MQKKQLIALGILGACLIAGGGYGWHSWQERQQAAIVRAAVPPIPDLSAWPRSYASRVRVATTAARRGEQAAAALRELASLYHANSNYEEAAQAERGLHALQPKNGQWTYFLADACEKLGDTDAQRTFLERTVQLAPHYPAARIRLADLLLKLGLLDEARVHYEWFLALVPNEPHGRLGLARIALERGDRTAALKELKALVQVRPDFSSGHNLLAEVYAAAGDAARAEEQRRLSGATGEGQVVADPWLDRLYGWSFDPYRIERAGGSEAQDRLMATALPFYKEAVRLAPDDGLAYDALGGLDLQLNRLEDAAAVCQRGIARAPKTPELYATLAQTLRRQRQTAKAIDILQRGILAVPSAAALPRDLGALWEESGRRDEAVAAYREAIRLEPRLADAHYGLGLCLLAAGQTAEAGASLGRALDLRPRAADALTAVAQKALAAGQLDQAACCIHAVIDHSPGTPVRSLVEQGLALARKAGDEKMSQDLARLLTSPLP